MRELAILQVGWLDQSEYEFTHHVRIGKEFGVSDDDIAAVMAETEGKESKLESLARTILKGVREMAGELAMSETTFAEIKRHLSDEEMVDLVLTIAFYCAVVRVLATMKIDNEPYYKEVLELYRYREGNDMRLKDRIAIVAGAGQSPGEGMGNGRATALTFAREGAKVLCVDHNLASAQETVEMIAAKGGTAAAFKADVTKNPELKAMAADAMSRWGRIDILHNNVGVSLAGGDAELLAITEEAFDRCVAINLKGCILAAKHVIPIMRLQKSGAIINISSMAAITTYPYVAYKATKSAMIAFTEQLAYQNAEYGIRANVILPGLMDTPMAVDTRAREFGKSRAEVAADRDSKVPLRRKMGTAWDVANAALFLASDEANFITGVTLPVDGGASVRRG